MRDRLPWKGSHVRECLAAHLHDPSWNGFYFFGSTKYAHLPEDEKDIWRERADAAIELLLSSEDSLRMMLIREILVEGKIALSSTVGGVWKLQEIPE